MTDRADQRARRYKLGVVGLSLVVFGLAAALMPIAPMSGDELMIALGLMLLATLGERTEFSFRLGDHAIDATIAGVPLVVAALVLPPHVAALVGAIAVLCIELRPGDELDASFSAANTALALTVSSLIAHAVFAGAPEPRLALLAGVTCALMFELAYTSMGMLLLELRQRGMARVFLREARPVIMFDIALATLGVVVVAPFIDSPLLLLGVLAAMLLVARGVVGTASRERVHRDRASMLEQNFSRYVPAEVVQQLIESDEQVELGGEARAVTVLFCDIRGFTTWAEGHAPAAVVTELNELLGLLAQCVFATGGTLDKFTGDGLMAFWGAPSVQPDHAARALDAALAMCGEVERHAATSQQAGRTRLAIGVGVHSGEVIVGNVGHAERHDYTAIGDTVNVAARLEAASKELGAPLVVSLDTLALLDQSRRARLRPAGSVSLKGRVAPVDVAVGPAGSTRAVA